MPSQEAFHFWISLKNKNLKLSQQRGAPRDSQGTMQRCTQSYRFLEGSYPHQESGFLSFSSITSRGKALWAGSRPSHAPRENSGRQRPWVMESEFGSGLSHDIGKVLCSSDTADLEVILPKTPAAQTSLHEHQGLLGTMCPVCSAPFSSGSAFFCYINVI